MNMNVFINSNRYDIIDSREQESEEMIMDKIIVAILFIIAIAMIILFIKIKKAFLLFCGAIACVGAIFGCYHLVTYYNDDIYVLNADEDGTQFDLKLKVHKDLFDGSYVDFSSKYDEEELFDEISSQYDNVFLENNDYIIIVYEDRIYSVKKTGEKNSFFQKKYSYELSREDVYVRLNEDEQNYIQIPFPSFAVESNRIENEDEKIVYDVDWKRYYEHIKSAEILEDKIEIQADGHTVELQFDDSKVLFEIQ